MDLSAVLVVGGSIETAEAELVAERFADAPAVKRLRQKGSIRVGVSFDEPNLAWRPVEGGPLQGFEIDVAKSLVRSVFGCAPGGVDNYLDLVEMKSSHRSISLVEDEVDLVVSNFADTNERRRSVAFAGHYLSSRFAPLLSPDSPDACHADDLAGLRVAAVAGTTGEDMLRRSVPKAEVVALDTVSACLEALAARRVDACWTTTAGNINYVNHPGAGFRQGQLRLGGEHWAVGVNRDFPELSGCVNEAMASLLSSGMLTQLMRRWLPELT